MRGLLRLWSAAPVPRKLAAVAMLAAAVFVLWPHEAGQWRVAAVADGDTLRLLSPAGEPVRARLQFVDAPELMQAGGPAARDALLRLVRSGAIVWRKASTDAYGRELGSLEVAGEDVALALLGEGWAWHYRRYAQAGQSAADYRRYRQAEAAARQTRRGLWVDPAAEPPWRWRQRHRDRRP